MIRELVEREDIIIALSHNQDVQRDVDSLVCRIAGIGRRNPMADRLQRVIDAENQVLEFIENSEQIWSDTGRRELYISASEKEHLISFKEYERLWASRKNQGTREGDWYKMQDELAEYIGNYILL